MESQVSERENELAQAKRWKKYVEAMARKHELPTRTAPWDLKADEEDKKASTHVEVVKIGEEDVKVEGDS